ncbi:MAG: arginase family protein [Roseiarcus sp.]
MIALTTYIGRAGDRNARAMRGALTLGEALAKRTGLQPRRVGTLGEPIAGGWAAQLEAAVSDLKQLGAQVGEILDRGARPLSAMGRCAASLATLPQVARRRPDAAIVWLDAHGDCNAPTEGAESADNYLGGMVLTGAAGLWRTGLGADMDLGQVVLVGGRDLDPPERARIERGEVALVEVGPDLGPRLRQAVRGRAVYVHIDCDVLDAGLVPTEYQVPGGLSLRDLAEACAVLAACEVVGVEFTEFEGEWPSGEIDDGGRLVEAVEPLLHRLGAA